MVSGRYADEPCQYCAYDDGFLCEGLVGYDSSNYSANFSIRWKASMVPWQTQQWIHEQFKNSELKVLNEKEGGVHAMFLDDKGFDVMSHAIECFLNLNSRKL